MSGVRATLIAVIGMTMVLLGVAYATNNLGLITVDCNPKGEAIHYDPGTDACYKFKASCKGDAQDVWCAHANVGGFVGNNTIQTNKTISAQVFSECGGYFCAGFSEAPPNLKSLKTSCKHDNGSTKLSLKRMDDKLCKPCCLKPDKETGCQFVCPK